MQPDSILKAGSCLAHLKYVRNYVLHSCVQSLCVAAHYTDYRVPSGDWEAICSSLHHMEWCG